MNHLRMRHTCKITIDLSRNEFIKKLDASKNLKHWKKGLVRYRFLSDTQGKEGAKMELNHQMGKRDVVLAGTIFKRNLPFEFNATYYDKGVHNIQRNHFRHIAAKTTQWISESEFQLSGLIMKIMTFIMPSAFRMQSIK